MADTQLIQSGAQVQADLNLTENLQDAFSTSSTYAVNDMVIYDSKLYKCTSAVSTAGAWDSSKWAQIHLSDLGASGGGGTQLYLHNFTFPDGEICRIVSFSSSPYSDYTLIKNGFVSGIIDDGTILYINIDDDRSDVVVYYYYDTAPDHIGIIELNSPQSLLPTSDTVTPL